MTVDGSSLTRSWVIRKHGALSSFIVTRSSTDESSQLKHIRIRQAWCGLYRGLVEQRWRHRRGWWHTWAEDAAVYMHSCELCLRFIPYFAAGSLNSCMPTTSLFRLRWKRLRGHWRQEFGFVVVCKDTVLRGEFTLLLRWHLNIYCLAGETRLACVTMF